MIFSYYVIILTVSLSLLCTSFLPVGPDLAWSDNTETEEKESVSTREDIKEETKTAVPEKTPVEATKSGTQKQSSSETKKTTESEKAEKVIRTQEYEIYPISVPAVELPEDIHIVDSNLNLTHGRPIGFPQAPGINVTIKKGDMRLSINIDPTYTDLFFDINLKDLGVEDAKVDRELKPAEKPEEKPGEKEEKERTVQQERLLNKIDEMMKALEKGKKVEKELKEKEKEEVLTKRQMENKVLEHIAKSQKFYYKKKYGLALNEAQLSLKIAETAMAYALEGTIYLALDDTTSAVESWKRALSLNPNMKEVRDMLEFYQNGE